MPFFERISSASSLGSLCVSGGLAPQFFSKAAVSHGWMNQKGTPSTGCSCKYPRVTPSVALVPNYWSQHLLNMLGLFTYSLGNSPVNAHSPERLLPVHILRHIGLPHQMVIHIIEGRRRGIDCHVEVQHWNTINWR